jgi:hypothetical protein
MLIQVRILDKIVLFFGVKGKRRKLKGEASAEFECEVRGRTERESEERKAKCIVQVRMNTGVKERGVVLGEGLEKFINSKL